MKRSWIVGAALVAVAAGLLSWGYVSREHNSGENITAVGSTALQPLVEAAGEDYAGKHEGIFINVQGGGTGTGLAQVQSGAVDLGNSDMFAEEKDGIDAKKLVDHKVAVVGIAPMINKDAGVKNLTQAQLIDIFTGKVKNWKEVGGKDMPIVLVNRVEGSGTRATFEKFGLKGAKSADAQEQDSSGMARSIVSTTPGAVSYAAFAYLDKSITVPTLNGQKATSENVENGNWPIWSYEHIYTKGQPKGEVKAFLDSIMSNHIQKTLVPHLGYISIHDMNVERDENGHMTKAK
ncbi:phosphate transport system substrate-binding protein [Weissella uvarum]|uniref:phosphate ABC transporter substrate-binding protein PstS family protein n=1 Tax=Weissella uvarum TaxID=1479233 RepID=UPI0019608F88|nr:phosphate ABC transporter substrate-binding protein PstS family protein [Weissella uvarum]MBM7616520.1 phosphate transport system substrate-binding protein [Weissella uvarum]MCM0595019.1 phosphate ABC transporter substrate-binding protein PstS family protein [Weissella uvarum]